MAANQRRTTLGPLSLSSANSFANISATSASATRASIGGIGFSSTIPANKLFNDVPKPTVGGENMNISSFIIPVGGSTGANTVTGTARRMSSRKSLSAPRGSMIGNIAGPSQVVSTLSQSQLISARVVDPRNIGDKQFMTNSIRALVDYLLQHNFNNEFPSTSISPKVLAKPTNKDFQNIVLFLFKQIDPNYKCTGKFEDEMITMFKFLGYPFQMAKSSISAVGSPHAWPSLLAAIMWLVELLQYDIAVQQHSNSTVMDGSFLHADNTYVDIDDPSMSEKAFYRYISKAYKLFLAGKDDQYEKLEEQFVSSFENKNVLIRDEIHTLEKRNHAITQEIEAVKGRSAYLPELEAKKKEFHADHQKFLHLMDELKKHRDQLRTKVDTRTAELERMKSTHDRAVREIAILRDRIANQELSAADVANMVNERQRLEEAQAVASENRQGLQRKIYELEMALRDKVQYLEDTARAYHTIAADLQLIPQNARNARGENLSIEIDISAKKREGLIKTDIRGGVLPVLHELKKELAETTLSFRAELLSEQDIADEIDCKRSELLGGKEVIEAKLKRAEIAYKREKDLLDQGTELHRQELDAMESRLQQLRDTANEESALAAATRKVSDMQTVRLERKQEFERKRAGMIEAITEAIARCANHRESVQKSLADLKAKYASRLGIFLNTSSASSGRSVSAASYENIARSILSSSTSQKEQPTLRSYLHPAGCSPSRSTQKVATYQNGSLSVGRPAATVVQHSDAPIAIQPQTSAVHVTYRAHQSDKLSQRDQSKSPLAIQSKGSIAVQYQDMMADSNAGRLQLPLPPSAFPSMQTRAVESSAVPPLAPSVPSHALVEGFQQQQQQQQVAYPQSYQYTRRPDDDIFRLAQDTDSVVGDDLSESMLSTQLSHSFMSEQPQSQHPANYSAYGARQGQLGQGAGYPYNVNPRRTLDFAACASSALSSSTAAAGKSSDGNYAYA